jgi:hypothetical protein
MMGVQPAKIGFLSDAARSGPYPVTRLTPEMLHISPPELGGLRFEFVLPRGWVDARVPVPAPQVALTPGPHGGELE